MREALGPAALVVVMACSGGSSSSGPPADAGSDGSAGDGATNGDAADASDAASTSDASDAGDPAATACGALNPTWTRCAANPLAVAGDKLADGNYELSIGDPDVQYDAWDNTWRAWWSTGLAMTYAAPDVDIVVKGATSPDGVKWNVPTTPVLSSHRSQSDWDWTTVETPSVIHVPQNPPDRQWLLYYSGGNKLVKTGPGGITWYQIGLAFSADGTSFTRLPATESPYSGKQTPYANIEGLLLLAPDAFPGLANVADGIVADPEIVRDDGGTFHLFFSSYAVDAVGNTLAYGVSHGTSQDGIHFTYGPNNPIAAINYSAGPSVYRAPDGTWELFFYRDAMADKAMVPTTFNPEYGVWRVTSPDLATWTMPPATRDFVWDGSFDYEKYGWIATDDAAFGAPEHRWYYVAFSSQNPPAGWVTPTHTGNAPAVIALSMARRK